MSVQSSNSRGCLFCPNHELGWHYKDVGDGPPLILLHGKRDWLLPPSARLRGEIPEHVIWQDRPGWGHVPMWDDPDGVTKFILEATA